MDISKIEKIENPFLLSFNEQMLICEAIAKGGICGFKKKEEVYSVLHYCKELKIPFMTGLNNMNVIKDTVGFSVHLQVTLAQRAGIEITRLKSNEAVYGYIELDRNKAKDNKPIVLRKHYKFNNDFHFLIKNSNELDKVPIDKVPVILKPIDSVTSYKFEKKINNEVVKTIIEDFYFSTAENMGLVKEGSAWLKDKSSMMAARCKTRGIREIDPSCLMMGIYSTQELKEINGIDVTLEDVTDYEEVK